VIDGKQRLESILMFMGSMRGRYEARAQLSEDGAPERVDWPLLKRRRLQHRSAPPNFMLHIAANVAAGFSSTLL
jgi:hypothetical protein